MDGDPHSHSIFYLFGTLVAGALPIFLLPCWSISVSRFFRFTWPSFNLRGIFNWNDYPPVLTLFSSTAPLLRFSSLAVCVIVFFYAIPESKRPVYLLSAYPFLAVLLAATLPVAWHNASEARDMISRLCWFSKRVYPVLLAVPFLISLCFIISWGAMREFAYGALIYRGYLHIFGLVVIAIVLAVAGFLIKRGNFNAESSGLVIKVFVGLLGAVFLEALVILWPGTGYLASEKKIAQVVQGIIKPNVTVNSFMHEFYGVSFYLERRIDRLEEQKTVQNQPKKSLVMLKNRDKQNFIQWISAQSKIKLAPLVPEEKSQYSPQAEVLKTNQQISLLAGKVLLYQIDYDL